MSLSFYQSLFFVLPPGAPDCLVSQALATFNINRPGCRAYHKPRLLYVVLLRLHATAPPPRLVNYVLAQLRAAPVLHELLCCNSSPSFTPPQVVASCDLAYSYLNSASCQSSSVSMSCASHQLSITYPASSGVSVRLRYMSVVLIQNHCAA